MVSPWHRSKYLLEYTEVNNCYRCYDIATLLEEVGEEGMESEGMFCGSVSSIP